jgi:hypothetical protein
MAFPLSIKIRDISFFAFTGLPLFVTLFFFHSEISPTFALELQHPKYQLQERKNSGGQVDRNEGIKPVEIAGEKLALVSVFLNAPDLNRERLGDTYRLGFFLREAENHVNLQVRDYNSFNWKYHYWMLPTRKKYDRGFKEFAWDAALPQELGIRLEDLGAVALLGGYGHPVITPLLLYGAPLPSQMQVKGCRFIFIPNETMTVEYRLSPKSEESGVILESTGEKWSKDQRRTISWEGQDHTGKPAPEGSYILRLTAKISSPGRPAERIPYDYEFYYKPEIALSP